MGVFVTIAIRNLIQARRRTLLLGTALFLVTMLLMVLLALSQGLTDTLIRASTTLSSGHVNVSGFFKTSVRQAAPILSETAPIREIVEQHTPGLDYVIDRHRGWCQVISDESSIYSGLTGVDILQEDRFLERIQVIEGDAKALTEDKTALIFAAQAERLDVGVGDMLTLSMETFTGQRNTGEVRIVAIAKDIGFLSNWNMFVPKSVVLDLYQLSPETTGAVMVYLHDVRDAPRVMAILREALTDAGYELMDHQPAPFWMKFETVAGEDWTGQKLDLTIWEDEVSFVKRVVTVFDGLSFVLVAILLGIIAVGIMNTMWIAVRERTNEVGTLRAIGMSRPRVLLMFMLEALMLGFLATSAGAIAGASLAAVVDAAAIELPWEALRAILMSDTLNMSVRPLHLVNAVVVFTLVTAVSALWPSFRASRLQPVTAIHKVG